MSYIKTGELLSFGDYSPEHGSDRSARIEVEAVHSNAYASPLQQPGVGGGDGGGGSYADTPSSGAPGDEPTATKSNHNFWTIEYYQKYFDVQTSEVMERIVSSVVPQKVSRNYFDERIRGKPDLYGPFWISTTLIFTIGVSSNIANYLQNAAKPDQHWRYDFHRLSYAATAIFSYVWLVPLALWAALKFTTTEDAENVVENGQASSSPSMMSLFCLYGYSLAIYIPVCVLWTIQISWLQWLFVLTAAFVSGAVLIFWLMPALRKSKYFPILIGCILVFHLLLATGFMLYFFHDPSAAAAVPLVAAAPLVPAAPVVPAVPLVPAAPTAVPKLVNASLAPAVPHN